MFRVITGHEKFSFFIDKNEFENFLVPREHPNHKNFENLLELRDYPKHKHTLNMGRVETLTQHQFVLTNSIRD